MIPSDAHTMIHIFYKGAITIMSNTQTHDVRTYAPLSSPHTVYFPLADYFSDTADFDALPMSLKVLLEGIVRHSAAGAIDASLIGAITSWSVRIREGTTEPIEVPFFPARIVLQDFTGVPVVVDLAAMRDHMQRLGGDPRRINPIVPVDLVIDHSVMVDAYGTPDARATNERIEFARNEERYRFLRWAQSSFDQFRAVPPGTGIVHQVNLEYLSPLLARKQLPDGRTLLYPDSVVGTDSHTTMINGLGVLGWGVGGIEAEAAMLGQPLQFLLPDVLGVRLIGAVREGVTATDIALTVTEMLRKKGVVGKFVEFFGESLHAISLPDRATIANMAPEYGATAAYFPVDAVTLDYLRQTGRDHDDVALIEQYYAAQRMLYRASDAPPVFTDTVTLDLSTIVTSLAGPKRPQDRIALPDMRVAFARLLRAPISAGGYGVEEHALAREGAVQWDTPPSSVSERTTLRHGDVVIAAITSCTNTSNPSVMVCAGLLAKKAVARGLTKPKRVKSSLTPGSLVVTSYLERAGLIAPLEALGFHVAGYGCATCIGNSGPLDAPIARAIAESDVTVAAVLSGNRNFEGRVHPQVKMNYLASPPLVIVYALTGTVDIDVHTDPIGIDTDGVPVYLRDIWPTNAEVEAVMREAMSPEMYVQQYRDVFHANANWNAIDVPQGDLYPWDASSTYIQNPPFFDQSDTRSDAPIEHARIIALLGDSVTTDHISPAGSIKTDSPAGAYLMERGVAPAEFNSYGSRRGNHEVMMRGTFANIRIRNAVAPGTEGGVTKHFPSGTVMPIYDAAMKYVDAGVPTVIFAGKEYGTGSSRDWAAKGTKLLGIRAVVAESFERIHRSNLVGMGVLPLQFLEGESWRTWGLDGSETCSIIGLETLSPGMPVTIVITRTDGQSMTKTLRVRLDSPADIEYYQHGGILPAVLQQLLA
jgi:aconitate hydratase